MPKKKAAVSLRKPSPAPDAPLVDAELESERMVADTLVPPSESRTVEAFVKGAAVALEQAASDVPSAKWHELLGRGPAGYRELTVYLPEGLARELSEHCLRQGLDLSRLVAAALEQHLHGTGSRERVAALARLLVGDLAHWLRSAWAARRRTAAPSGVSAEATA